MNQFVVSSQVWNDHGCFVCFGFIFAVWSRRFAWIWLYLLRHLRGIRCSTGRDEWVRGQEKERDRTEKEGKLRRRRLSPGLKAKVLGKWQWQRFRKCMELFILLCRWLHYSLRRPVVSWMSSFSEVITRIHGFLFWLNAYDEWSTCFWHGNSFQL